MTRRTFFGTIGAGIIARAWAGTRPSLSTSPGSESAGQDAWARARDIVRSGAVGTVVWAQMTTPPGVIPPRRELDELLEAMGVRDQPRRITKLNVRGAAADATTILEFASDPPVYLAPGSGLASTIRGTRARLHVVGNAVQVIAHA